MKTYRATLLSVAAALLLIWQVDAYFEIKKNLTLFSEVYQEISSRYVDNVDAGTLLRTGIHSMLTLLDPYTVLYDEGDDAVMDMLVNGSYTGVGIEVGARGGQLVIIAPIEGYSAHEKGVRAGDVILAVDGVPVDGYSIEDLYSLLKGEVGTDVDLSLRRPGLDEVMIFTLTRARVEVRNVAHTGWLDEPAGIVYVALSSFGANASEEIRDVLKKLQAQRAVNGIVLDLRNNPGGLLDEAVRLVDLFLPAGQPVVRTSGRSPETREQYRTREAAFFTGALVVLQNNGSASSSEIVSGALQDTDRAVIIGDRSFGKGLVQIVRPLSYGVALKLTVSRYYTPSGRSIQALQYRHDGSDATVLEEGQRTEFKTRNGRTVKDGFGIEPDIRIPEPDPNRLDLQLRQGGYYFKFANEYRSRNATYSGITLPDTVFSEFTRWLRNEGFTYQTRSLSQFADLMGGVSETDRRQDPQSWAQLERRLQDLRDREFQSFSEDVRRELHDELSARYLGSKALAQQRLERDPAIREAVDVLKDAGRFNALLNGRP